MIRLRTIVRKMEIPSESSRQPGEQP